MSCDSLSLSLPLRAPLVEQRANQARLEFWQTVRELRATAQATDDLHARLRLNLESARLQSLMSEYRRKRREHRRRLLNGHAPKPARVLPSQL
jgi:hypothetical protein